MTARSFPSGAACAGTNESTTTEKLTLSVSLFSGSPATSRTLQDHAVFDVSVPAATPQFTFLFDGLVSTAHGDHFVSVETMGRTLYSAVFQYE